MLVYQSGFLPTHHKNVSLSEWVEARIAKFGFSLTVRVLLPTHHKNVSLSEWVEARTAKFGFSLTVRVLLPTHLKKCGVISFLIFIR